MRAWAHKHPAVFGFLLAWAIAGGVFYASQFHLRNELLTGCERGNIRAQEINDRVPVINTLVENQRLIISHSIGLKRAGLARDLAPLRPVKNVSLADCEAAYDKPWPFG